jgi:hypothetical protein
MYPLSFSRVASLVSLDIVSVAMCERNSSSVRFSHQRQRDGMIVTDTAVSRYTWRSHGESLITGLVNTQMLIDLVYKYRIQNK